MLLRKIAVCFSAGGLGGLINSLVVWLAGLTGISAALGVGIAPPLTAPWLYQRIVWGGLWAFLFLLPVMKSSPYLAGLVWSLGPTIVQLCVIFPFVANKGFFGLELGMLTPLLVVVFNAVWGVVAAFVLVKSESD
jgi:hypothetical protein